MHSGSYSIIRQIDFSKFICRSMNSQCWSWNCSLSYTHNTPCSNYRSDSLNPPTLFTATFSRHTKQHLAIPSFYGITGTMKQGDGASPCRTDSGKSRSCFCSVLSIASSSFPAVQSLPFFLAAPWASWKRTEWKGRDSMLRDTVLLLLEVMRGQA